MRVTASLFKADVGGVGGHTRPSPQMLADVEGFLSSQSRGAILLDHFLTYLGDDIFQLLIHTHGVQNPAVHKLAWDSFFTAGETAESQNLYGAKQDLIKTEFVGNVSGMGPGVAEMEFNIRTGECLVMLMADKTEPSAFSPIFYNAFCDPNHTHGMLLSKALFEGFEVFIFDTKTGKEASFMAPAENREILTLTAYNSHRFVFRRGYSRSQAREIAFVSVTDRLHDIAGRYVGKDDPGALARTQKIFPATEELLTPLATAYLVGGDTRGSHYMPLMPVAAETPASSYHCIPMVAALAFSLRKDGKLSDPVDLLAGKEFDETRSWAMKVSQYMLSHGAFSPFMLPPEELEYGDIAQEVEHIIEERFE